MVSLRAGVCAVVVVAAVIGSAPAHAQNAADRGVTWLFAHQDPDGGFGGATGEDRVLATSEALLALQSLGLGSSPQADAAATFLALTKPKTLGHFARRITALTRTPLADSASAQQLRTRLLSVNPLLGPPTGFAAGFDGASAAEAALALRALIPQGSSADSVRALEEPALELLLMSRAGGYAITDEDNDTFTTATLIEGLAPFRFRPWFAGPLDRFIRTEVLARQTTSGDFGDGKQPVLDTAQGVLVLGGLDQSRFTEDLQLAAVRARSYLSGAQANDGSWGGSIYATALVLRALGAERPNWAHSRDEGGVASIVFDNPEPLSGETIYARLMILNRSTAAAPSTTIAFTAKPEAGGPSLLLKEVVLSPLAAGATTSVTVPLVPLGLSGRYSVEAFVDPGDSVAELDESDNKAYGTLNVKRDINLTLASTDITFLQTSATELRVSARVHNQGEPVGPFQVELYRGNPASGGTRLGTVAMAGLGVASEATAALTTPLAGLNGPTAFFAVVDTTQVIEEAREDDNRAFRFYFPGTAAPVDIGLPRNSLLIGFTPAVPTVGVPFLLSVPISNYGTTDAVRVPLRILDATSVMVAQTEVDMVPAGKQVVANVELSLRSPTQFTILLDPDQQLADVNRYDNSIQRSISTLVAAPDVRVLSLSSNYHVGVPGTATASVFNGASVSVSTEVAWYSGDPLLGNARELGRTSVQVPGNGSVDITSPLLPFADGDLYTACVDPLCQPA